MRKTIYVVHTNDEDWFDVITNRPIGRVFHHADEAFGMADQLDQAYTWMVSAVNLERGATLPVRQGLTTA